MAGFVPPPIYCYRTIADADCYASPAGRHRQRIVAYQGHWPGYGPRPRVPYPSAPLPRP